jgi:hypothetical protein
MPPESRWYWYVRHWDEHQKRYAAHRSTGVEAARKKERRSEAERIALEIFPSVCFDSSRTTMLEYLASFWKTDSLYFRKAEMIRGRKLSAYYTKSHAVARLHIAVYPGFRALGLGKLAPPHPRLDAPVVGVGLYWGDRPGGGGHAASPGSEGGRGSLPGGKPLCNGYFRLALIAELEAVGISAEEGRRRNISFHSPPPPLRHAEPGPGHVGLRDPGPGGA